MMVSVYKQKQSKKFNRQHAFTSWAHVAHSTPVELGSIDGLTAGSQTETDTAQTTCMRSWKLV